MEGRTLNLVNIGLMLISCLVAFILPFELFLFSYAVLGPLHYLTEIGWLHKRNYFTSGKADYLWLGFMALCITLATFHFKSFNSLANMSPFIALFSALIFILIKNPYLKVVSIMLAIFAYSFMNDLFFYTVFFLVFLPTILHVFLFTGSFILIGAMRTKSSSGIVSLFVFIGCALSFFLVVPNEGLQFVSEYIRDSYKDFSILNRVILSGMDRELVNSNSISNAVFHSPEGLMIMRFIAFSYTYHYLNWFSKTSVIKWHKVDKRYLVATVIIWILSVVIYLYDYHTGLRVLFFLSFLHVFLEFPLNWRTFIDIGKEMKNLTVFPLKLSKQKPVT